MPAVTIHGTSSGTSSKCCNGCEGCNTSCNGTGCLSKQSFCKIGKENSISIFGTFNFKFEDGSRCCVSSGQIIGIDYFSRDVWNTIINRINNVFSFGVNIGLSEVPINEKDIFMTAKEFNRIAEKVNLSTRVEPNDLIKGTYFEDLEKAATNLKFHPDQCEICNMGCNSCNTCQVCNNKCLSGNAPTISIGGIGGATGGTI